MPRYDDIHLASEYSPTPSPPRDVKPSRSPRTRLGRAAAAILMALGTGTGAVVVAIASTSGSAPALAAARGANTKTPSRTAATSSPTSQQVWAARQHFMLGLGQAGTLGPNVVRATLIVKGTDGKYGTVSVQKGTAQQVGSDQITVKSTDGVSQTYEVLPSTAVSADEDNISSVKANDYVSVLGSVDGSTYTAERVVDLTQVAPAGAGTGAGYGQQGR